MPRGPERGSSQLLLGDLLNCGLKEGMTSLVLDTTGQVTGSGEPLPHSLPGLKVLPRERSPSSCTHCVDSTPGAEGGMELGARSGVPQTPGLGASCSVREAALWALGAGVWPEAPVGTLGGFTEEAKGPWGCRATSLGWSPRAPWGGVQPQVRHSRTEGGWLRSGSQAQAGGCYGEGTGPPEQVWGGQRGNTKSTGKYI